MAKELFYEYLKEKTSRSHTTKKISTSVYVEVQKKNASFRCDYRLVVIFFKPMYMYNKTIIRFSFCDIWNTEWLLLSASAFGLGW